MRDDIVTRFDVMSAISELNARISQTGEPIEGNICYWNQTPSSEYGTAPPITDPDHIKKRTNLAVLASRRTSMLEIGLNGGHSALICLLSNPYLSLFSVDIAVHRYTNIAAEYLKFRFGHRFTYWPGDSREVLPRAALERPNLRFDLLHVDGGHGAGLAMADISNSLRMAAPGAELVLDDTNAVHLGAILDHVVGLGYLAPLQDYTNLEQTVLHRHQILKVC
jgi:predicted O-methyltransferase YrrM